MILLDTSLIDLIDTLVPQQDLDPTKPTNINNILDWAFLYF